MNEIEDEHLLLKAYYISKVLESSHDDSIKIFLENIDLLNDVYFIIPSDDVDGIDYLEQFNNLQMEGIGVNYFFVSNRLVCFNRDYILAKVFQGQHTLKVEKIVSLDTQIQSYLFRKYKDGIKTLPSSIDEILKLIKGRKWLVDCLAYSMENVLFNKDMLKDQLYIDNMFAFETYFFGNNRKAKSYMKKIMKSEEEIFFGKLGDWYRRQYLLIYLELLVMVDIKLNKNNLSLYEKEKKYFEFFHNKISIISETEVNLAKLFFMYGTKIGFFGKIQKGRSDIVSNLKNMAWDIFHIRNTISNITKQTDKQIDFTIPYFVTYDKRLKDILNVYKIKSAAFIKGTSLQWFRYVTDLLDPVLKNQYFSVEYRNERLRKINGITEKILIDIINQHINEYENKFNEKSK